MLCDSLPFWGGGEHWIVQVGSALRDRGWQITVAGRHDAELLKRAATAGLTSIAWPFHHDFDLPTLAAASRWLKVQRPDIVLVTTARDIRSVGFVARRHKIPVVWRMGPKPKRSLVHRLTGKCIVRRVIAPSHYAARELQEFPWLRSKVSVIHNGIKVGELPSPQNTTEKRRRWGLAPEGLLILYVGRLLPGKGVSVLLRALAKTARTHPSTHLAIVGTGSEEADLRDLARVLNIDRRVSFHGYTSDPSAYFETCDIFVQPSRYESFSYVLLEAMALSKPCIAARSGAIPEVVGDSALLVAADQSDELSDALNRMIADPESRDIYAAAGRRHVMENFTLDKCVAAVDSLFREVAGI